MIKYLLLLVAIFLSFTGLFAQSPSASCVKSTEGKEFWFGFMENRNYQVPQYPTYLPVVHYTEISLVSEHQCKVDIFIGKSLVPSYSVTVLPNIPLQVQIPWNDVEAMGSETVQDKAIHLVSDNPLNLYAFNWCEKSSDVALIFPKESIGNEYYAMCYTPNIDSYFDQFGNEIYRSGRNSEFLIVATENNTSISITPTKITDQLHPANIPFTITLNKGELYQVQSMNYSNLAGQGDLTGSHIQSNKPISMFSGSLATSVPAEKNVDAWDHLYEQMPPVHTWGRKFVTVPLKGRSKDVFRVLASQDNTTLRIGKTNPVMLNKGAFYEFVLNENEPTLIDSDRPVLLAQYMTSNSVDRPAGRSQYDWDGDPFMVIVSPVDQTRESVTFIAYNSTEIKDKYYVNVVTKDESVNQILLDNNDIPFQKLDNSGYSFAQVKIDKGQHNLSSTEAGKGFIAYVYGYGGVESYGYGVGYNLSTRLDLGGDIQFVKDTILLCKGDNRVLDAGSYFSNFLWNTGETTQKISVSKKGYYEVKASTPDGCQLTDGINVIENNQVANLGNDATLCLPGSVVLNAGDFASYKWSTLDTTRTITVSTPGLYGVTVSNKYGCSSKDTVMVTTSQRPKLVTDQLDTLVCGIKTTTVNITADKGNYSLSSNNSNVLINNLIAKVPDFGSYTLIFKATDTNSCSTDTSFVVRFRRNNPAAIMLDSTCVKYSLDARYLGDADKNTAFFTWIFAGDTLVNGLSRDQLHKPLGYERVSGDLKLIVSEAECQSQVAVRKIEIVPDLDFSVSDTVLCQPDRFYFTTSHTENISEFTWNWGDGITETTAGNASHVYSKEGYYTVQLIAKTDKNCSNTITKENLVYVAPVPSIAFSVLENQCLAKGVQSLSYLGTADKMDHFRWDLSSFSPGDIVQDPGDSPGPLLFNFKSSPQAKITLQVTSKFHCLSESKSTTLKSKPQFSLTTATSSGCNPYTAGLAAKSEIPQDEVSYKWNFGDETSGVGTEVEHTYTIPNQLYDVTLMAISAITGCTDTLRNPGFINVFPTPEAAFSMDQQIFLTENPTVNLYNESFGANRFNWMFGDGDSSQVKNPSHQYLVAGRREVILEAYNDFGCMDTARRTVSIALSRIYTPNAFAPNAINAEDREFRLFATGVKEEGYHLRIFSRWDDLVFECKNEIKGWNGRLSNGNHAQTGTYIWILEYSDFLGKAHRQKGTVVLVY